jgi:hypothetical protein
MKKFWLMACVLLGLALSGGAQTAAAPDRDPELRQIDAVKDAPALARLEFIRATLPEEFRKRNNFAWAVAKIDGLKKVEYFAHSGIQDLDSLSSQAAKAIKEISVKPEKKAKFKTLCVNQNGAVEGADCWQRDVDTEYKILEDLASRLKDPAAAGRVRLYTELYPCPSCWNVMKQFLAVYTNVQMQVLYRKN